MTEAAHRFAKDQLKSFIERIERLEEEKKALSDDIRDVMAEAKNSGFDVKALREIVRRRKMDVDERQEQDAILETYMHALGMLDYVPEREPRSGQGAATSTRAQSCAANGDVITHSARPVLGSLPPGESEHTTVPAPGRAEPQPAVTDDAVNQRSALVNQIELKPSAQCGSSLPGGLNERCFTHPSHCAETDTQSPSSGGDRPHPAPSARQIPPGEADDLEIPPFLRRDSANRAPFMREPPREPRPPP